MIKAMGKERLVSIQTSSSEGRVLLTAKFRGEISEDFQKKIISDGMLWERGLSKLADLLETVERFDLDFRSPRFEIEAELPGHFRSAATITSLLGLLFPQL